MFLRKAAVAAPASHGSAEACKDGLVAAVGEGERAVASADAAAGVNSVAASGAWKGRSSCSP